MIDTRELGTREPDSVISQVGGGYEQDWNEEDE